jgi:hypothetical protein
MPECGGKIIEVMWPESERRKLWKTYADNDKGFNSSNSLLSHEPFDYCQLLIVGKTERPEESFRYRKAIHFVKQLVFA